MLEILRLSTTYLAQHGSTTPRLDAEVLAAAALGLRRIDLYLQFDRPLDEPEVARLRESVRRRAAREPVAYITGEREFYGRPFFVSPDVLIPRPDTETLVEAALRVAGARDAALALRIADLGTGSGCIAVTLACELPHAEVVATDISRAALDIAARNAQRHGVAERVQLLHGSWADPLVQPVDIVVSNPPYVTQDELSAAEPEVSDHEPRLALLAGNDGMEAYPALARSLHNRLRTPADVLLEVDPRRADDVDQVLGDVFPGSQTQHIADLTRRTRVVSCSISG